ncbi:hypothetical protein FRC04_005750 [Tulasnella sp. 424]|nr:hypothetical protein FRC04_005750 [Tulasnella sp. 424]
MASSTSGNTHAIIVAVAEDDQGLVLEGVKWDLPLINEELYLRTTETLHVITDLDYRARDDRTQVLPSTLRRIETAIRNVGEALRPGDVCYVYTGHAIASLDRTAFMPLPNRERLHGAMLSSWLRDATRSGGTMIAIADVCHSTAFLGMPVIYDLNNDGSIYCTRSGGREADFVQGQVVVVSATEYNQFARTIRIQKGGDEEYHGFFTWVLFNYLKGKSRQVDVEKLLLYLRQECAKHPQKPRPQVSATTGGLLRLPLGRTST